MSPSQSPGPSSPQSGGLLRRGQPNTPPDFSPKEKVRDQSPFPNLTNGRDILPQNLNLPSVFPPNGHNYLIKNKQDIIQLPSGKVKHDPNIYMVDKDDNGLYSLYPNAICYVCGKPAYNSKEPHKKKPQLFPCNKCKKTFYCSKEHQKMDAPNHETLCVIYR